MSLGMSQDKLVPGNGPSVSQLNFSKVTNIFMQLRMRLASLQHLVSPNLKGLFVYIKA